MPLPAALQAKLQKRGILNQSGGKIVDTEKDFKGAVLCPNKYNIHHNCTVWCQNHWKGFIAPDAKYTTKIRRMLEKYPLPHNWTEIFDKGIGRYYYWNMETNMVSWLPPRHPKAEVAEPAAKFRLKLYMLNNESKDIDKKKPPKLDKEKFKEKHDKRHGHRHEDRMHSNRKKPRKDDLDPMDPAAYSDIPRGSWSDGLETSKAKADSTATGAVYQQRPYPPPGNVLASNKANKKNK